jgi:uncharacterized membrane protein YphA (DoxX/SURF4 family)
MSLIRRLARPMLASTFIAGGVDALRNPKARADVAGPVATKVAAKLPMKLPQDPVDLVRLDAAVKIGAGLALAMGRFPRLASATLAASLVPTTFAGHPFWQEQDPARRNQQRVHFFKNVSMLGGLILAALDTEGEPSLRWRARHAAQHASKETHRATRHATRETRRATRLATKEAQRAAWRATRAAEHARERISSRLPG